MKELLVICNEEDTDGRARVTRDEERVLPVTVTVALLVQRCVRLSSSSSVTLCIVAKKTVRPRAKVTIESL